MSTMSRQKIKRKKSKIKTSLLAGLITMLIALIGLGLINWHVVASVQERIITPQEAAARDIDCILVLGAGVWDNARPSSMLEDRLLQGVALYQSGASDRLLMSGDHGQANYDEVNVMKQYAIDLDVPSSHIFMDHAGFSTYESVYRAKTIFKAEKIIIVTQRYHLYRALYLADALGVEAYGVASDPRTYLGQTARDLREVLARVKDFAYGMFQPEPTYLGEVIPISGNGDVTND